MHRGRHPQKPICQACVDGLNNDHPDHLRDWSCQAPRTRVVGVARRGGSIRQGRTAAHGDGADRNATEDGDFDIGPEAAPSGEPPEWCYPDDEDTLFKELPGGPRDIIVEMYNAEGEKLYESPPARVSNFKTFGSF